MSSSLICRGHAFQGFVPQCGRCWENKAEGHSFFFLFLPEHGNPSQVVRSLWIVGKGEANHGRMDSGSSPAGKNKNKLDNSTVVDVRPTGPRF